MTPKFSPNFRQNFLKCTTSFRSRFEVTTNPATPPHHNPPHPTLPSRDSTPRTPPQAPHAHPRPRPSPLCPAAQTDISKQAQMSESGSGPDFDAISSDGSGDGQGQTKVRSPFSLLRSTHSRSKVRWPVASEWYVGYAGPAPFHFPSLFPSLPPSLPPYLLYPSFVSTHPPSLLILSCPLLPPSALPASFFCVLFPATPIRGELDARSRVLAAVRVGAQRRW